MLRVIRSLLLKIVDDIDAGNSTVVIFDKWGELGRFLPKEEMEQEAKAITINQYGASLVAINSKRGSSIIHEAEHIKNSIWRYIGYTPQEDNDEVDAYLITYIYDKITSIFYKHDRLIKS